MEPQRNGARAARSRGRLVLPALFFLAATVLATWPQAPRMASGLGDLWDAKLNAWIFHWDYHQTFRDPRNLFHGNIFHPSRYTLAFSENLWGAAVFGFPLFAAGASTLLVYNFLFLLGMFLSALGAWALARYVTVDPAASLLAGVVYAFVPWRLSQIPHVQFQWGAFLPLLLLFLLRWLDGGRRRDLVLFGVFFAWNALANVHYALFSGILLAVALAWEALTSGAAAEATGATSATGAVGSTVRRRIRTSLLAAGVAGVVVLPFYLPYARASKLYAMRRDLGEMQYYSATPSAFLVAGHQNKLWAPLTQRWSRPEAELFPGLVPVALAVYACVALRRRRPAAEDRTVNRVSDRRRRVARLFDALALLSIAAWIAALSIPGLRLGFVKLRDPGRALVVLTVVVLVRLLIAFPRRSRFENLADFLRRRRLDPRAGMFVAVAAVGILVALGGNTPYYRFLFRTFGFLFRAVRVPARGIVLFHVALAVLAAWGLALLARRLRSSRERGALVAAALVLTAIEYRAAPIEFPRVEKDPAPVYRWLAGVRPGGAVLELPIGFDFDAEHVFRSPAHWQRLINGYSGFAPRHYEELKGLFEQSPVTEEAWSRARALGGAVLVFHPHEADGLARLNYSRAVRRELAGGGLDALGSFAHGSERDFVFRIVPAPAFPTGIPPEDQARDRAEFQRLASMAESELAPPFGVLDAPLEDAVVAPGSGGFGWALDDSGIAEVRVASELGPAPSGFVGGPRPDVLTAHPGYADAARSGFGIVVPQLPPGPHTLTVTLVARDGGEKVITRRVRIR